MGLGGEGGVYFGEKIRTRGQNVALSSCNRFSLPQPQIILPKSSKEATRGMKCAVPFFSATSNSRSTCTQPHVHITVESLIAVTTINLTAIYHPDKKRIT